MEYFNTSNISEVANLILTIRSDSKTQILLYSSQGKCWRTVRSAHDVVHFNIRQTNSELRFSPTKRGGVWEFCARIIRDATVRITNIPDITLALEPEWDAICRVSFRQIAVRVEPGERWTRIEPCVQYALWPMERGEERSVLRSRLYSVRECTRVSWSAWRVRACSVQKSAAPYTCPSVHQSFSEVRED